MLTEVATYGWFGVGSFLSISTYGWYTEELNKGIFVCMEGIFDEGIWY